MIFRIKAAQNKTKIFIHIYTFTHNTPNFTTLNTQARKNTNKKQSRNINRIDFLSGVIWCLVLLELRSVCIFCSYYFFFFFKAKIKDQFYALSYNRICIEYFLPNNISILFCMKTNIQKKKKNQGTEKKYESSNSERHATNNGRLIQVIPINVFTLNCIPSASMVDIKFDLRYLKPPRNTSNTYIHAYTHSLFLYFICVYYTECSHKQFKINEDVDRIIRFLCTHIVEIKQTKTLTIVDFNTISVYPFSKKKKTKRIKQISNFGSNQFYFRLSTIASHKWISSDIFVTRNDLVNKWKEFTVYWTYSCKKNKIHKWTEKMPGKFINQFLTNIHT